MDVQVTRLANGMTVVTENMPQLESVATGVWVKSGSRNETENQHGIAHLLEHMAFKGTSRRSARQIAEEIENVGGEVNASTSTETTSYYARVLKDDVPLAIDILADILTQSRFDADELRREQHVILQEIGAAQDTPDDIVFDRFSETAFKGQPIGRSILGTPTTVQSFDPADIKAFLATHYTGNRMIVVAAGAVDHDAFVTLVEERFAAIPVTPIKTPEIEPARYTGGEIRETRELLDAQILIGFEGRAYHARDFYASQVLANILGGGMSSRLFQEIREKRGLCYSVYAFHMGFSDTGIFGVHAATGEEDVAELVPVILKELAGACDGIEAQEVDRARAQIRAGLLMARESPMARANQLARNMLLYGRPISNEELMDRLSKITAERLSDLAGRLFWETVPSVAAIGPLSLMMDYQDIQAHFSGATEAPKTAHG